ncbi:MAG: hypothetical protein U0X73_12615 [Thermoanaerobaculia bacterium]
MTASVRGRISQPCYNLASWERFDTRCRAEASTHREWSYALEKQSISALMRRLSRAGFKKEFVRPALLPEWWDESSADEPGLLQDVELRVARFLGAPLATIRDPSSPLTPPTYPRAQLRRVRDIERDRLAPALHTAIRVAAAVVRCLKPQATGVSIPPDDGLAWRSQIARIGPALELKDIVTDLWARGIPVVPLEVLPAPSFQGIACFVEGRPVVGVAHRNDEPGRLAYLVAHEAGHIAARDCAPEQPVIDEEEEIADDADIEARADRFATRLVAGGDAVPDVKGGGYKELAQQASDLERSVGVDASAVIFAWARQTGDFAKATMAVRALYRGSGGRRQLREIFDRHVDLDAATETDRALLRCVYGDPDLDEATA